MLADFHFLRPLWLLALVGLPIAWMLRHRRRSAQSAWQRVVDAELLPHVMAGDSANPDKQRTRTVLVMLLCYTLAVVALAGPVWKRVPRPVFKDRSALVIMLDLSRSMDAQDIKPSRLARARFKIADLLARRGAGLTGLVVYAADAYSVVPLTDDTATIMSQLPVLETGLMPAQGSNPARAVTRAVELLEQSGLHSGDLLLITDSVTDADVEPIRSQLNQKAYRLSILAVGTAKGAPIPKGGGEFIRDDSGKLVLAQLTSETMQPLADSMHGLFTEASNDQSDVAVLSAQFHRHEATHTGQPTDLAAQQWREEGPWLLLPMLPLAALMFRRGLLLSLLLGACLLPTPAPAWSWDDLWLRPDQQAARDLANGDATKAAAQFQNRRWQAVARYRSADFAGALQSLEHPESSDDFYNRGNTLARSGQTEAAIAAYEKALALNKGNADAQYNLDLLRKLQQQSSGQSSDTNGDSADNRAKNNQSDSSNSQQSKSDRSGSDHSKQEESSSQESSNANNSQPSTQSQNDNNAADQRLDELLAKKQAEPQGERHEQPEPERGEKEQATPSGPHDEQQQADEQWLRRIPDDPGGLLRRKFYYQYSQSNQVAPSNEPW